MKFKILFVLFFSCFKVYAAGGTDISGGGYGLKQNSKVLLLDLVEQGFSSSFSIPLAQNSNCEKMLKNSKAVFTSIPLQKKYCFVLQQIAAKNSLLAHAIHLAAEFYNWTFIHTDLALVTPVDSVIADQSKIIQVAVRKGEQIFINIKAWQMMNDDHKVALIYHELLSSLAKLEISPGRDRWIIGSILKYSLADESIQFNLNRIFLHYFDLESRIKKKVFEKFPVESHFFPESLFSLDHKMNFYDKGLQATYFPILKVDYCGCKNDQFQLKSARSLFYAADTSFSKLKSFNESIFLENGSFIAFNLQYVSFALKVEIQNSLPKLDLGLDIVVGPNSVAIDSMCKADFKFPILYSRQHQIKEWLGLFHF